MGKLLHEELSYKIRGSLFRVYNTLGPGFREETYKQATKHDLSNALFKLYGLLQTSVS